LYDKGFIREPKGVVALRSWDMRRFGVLDGGLPAWIKEGYATEKRQEQLYEKGDFTANFQPQLFKTKEQVLENIQTKALLVDARSTDRFLPTRRATSWIEKWTPVQ
jgi:thiosulfate/3-mercaptopyruvate sulfurtransferase